MKRIKIGSLFLISCLIIATALCACDSMGGILDGDKFDFKDYDEFKENTKNYSMTISNNDQTIVIKVCENGYLYDNGSDIYFYNGVEKKGYSLHKADKTGVVNTYENGENLYDWENNGGLIDMLYSFQVLKLFMKKEGTGKIAGRDCTIYTYEKDGVKSKFWLDNEFGMCLKSENTENGKTETMEITDFTLGDVTLANMIDLSVYTVTEGVATTKTVEAISIKSNTVPTNKTPNTFVLSDIKITVNYNDSSQEEVSLTENMLSATNKESLETAGTHSITVTYQGKTTTFSITLVATEKTVASIAVKSQTIPFGKTTDNFLLSDIQITVSYEDNSQEDISLSENMISTADKESLETAGTYNITVNYGGKTTSVTVTIEEAGLIDSPITNSIQDFYSNIALDITAAANGFIPTMAMDIAISQPEFKDYYEQSVEGRADTDYWSAPSLLLDASFQIKEHLEGSFDTDEIDFGDGVKKSPSCTKTASGYSVNYSESKGLYRYWFETEIEYDQETDSLRAEIYCGVNENQELKYIIEYNKTSDGNYMCLIHFPNEIIEGNPQRFTTLRLYFKGIIGRVSINRWQIELLSEPNLIYGKTDDASYADDGDAVINTDGETVACPIDNLKSGFYDDFNAFFAAMATNRESLYDEESEEDKHISYGNNSESLMYIMEDIYVGSYTIYEIIKSYDNKIDLYIDEGNRLVTTCMGDAYNVSYENEYEEIIISVRYDQSGSFYILKEVDGQIMLRFQWVKIGSAHFMEVNIDDYGTFVQYKYTFETSQNTMQFVSIYEMNNSIEMNIYKATNLDAATFATEPNTASYPYYEHFSFASNELIYNFSFGGDSE